MNITALILIGASTGGPGRMYSILSALERSFNGTVIIAQHMGTPFIQSFVHQLQSIASLPISAVTLPTVLERGHVYVCSVTSCLFMKDGEIVLIPAEEDGEYPYNPQIDILFSSASTLPCTLKRLGVILTGIGDDGAVGSLELFESGGECLFESEESAIVYGMPRRAKELVSAAGVGSVDEIIKRIQEFGGSDVRMV